MFHVQAGRLCSQATRRAPTATRLGRKSGAAVASGTRWVSDGDQNRLYCRDYDFLDCSACAGRPAKS